MHAEYYNLNCELNQNDDGFDAFSSQYVSVILKCHNACLSVNMQTSVQNI